MGGKNHQPCAIYLKSSTKMSRAMSAARARLESANIALEDILLAEFEKNCGNATVLIEELMASKKSITEALNIIGGLRKDMERNNFQELPSLREVSLSSTGLDFTREGIVNKAAWDKVASLMKSEGFWGVLGLFESRLNSLAALNDALVDKFEALVPVIAAGELSFTVEQNRNGNFKTEFARVYNAWGVFEQEFLASSMLSTELWYQFNSFGSLRGHGATARVA